MRIIIVWNETKEPVKIFSIKTSDQELIYKIKKAHGQVVNITDRYNWAIWLSNFLSTHIPMDPRKPIDISDFDLLVTSGFAANQAANFSNFS